MTNETDPPPATSPLSRRIFFGPHGLRASWSLALYFGAATLLTGAFGWVFLQIHPLPEKPPWTAGLILAFELVSLAAALLATLLLARVEGRPLAAYGLPARGALGAVGRPFWTGALWGFLSISAVVGAIWACGGYEVHGLHVHGAEAVKSMVLWLLATLALAAYEEVYFRAAPLFTLSRGLGFWPAALLFSLYFGGVHYFQKPMETWVDGLSTGLLGLWLCLSVRRTGDIRMATGFHFAYNFGSLALFGGPNTGNQGNPVAGRLLDATFHGSQYLTGGPMGPEASLFVFPVIALLFTALHFRYRVARFPRLGGEP